MDTYGCLLNKLHVSSEDQIRRGKKYTKKSLIYGVSDRVRTKVRFAKKKKEKMYEDFSIHFCHPFKEFKRVMNTSLCLLVKNWLNVRMYIADMAPLIKTATQGWSEKWISNFCITKNNKLKIYKFTCHINMSKISDLVTSNPYIFEKIVLFNC